MVMSASLLRRQIVEIEEALASLHQQVASLEDQQARLTAQLRDIKYPILSVPEDLTLHIWSFVVQPRPQPVHEVFSSAPVQPAIVMASVCRAWRELALSTTTLWTTITASWQHQGFERCNALLSLFLQRSGSVRLLDVDLHFSGQDTWTPIEEAFRILAPEADRLRRIRLSSWAFSGLISRGTAFPLSLPRLEEIDLGNFIALRQGELIKIQEEIHTLFMGTAGGARRCCLDIWLFISQSCEACTPRRRRPACDDTCAPCTDASAGDVAFASAH
ncbi:hypothetical protein MIND_00933700 [Mycena indigotica]|uniref:F-box domain-containing protein n=1 Tax=Mycena indigotica TaxID=2126181 RepID=A0A8H6VWV3_9AGAR|nr:uncharacterized protein MIND_00933700 [Mycena indigotica]KAF7297014.1 hypothetical protein MIND_00933700 [Mycena indigotica]